MAAALVAPSAVLLDRPKEAAAQIATGDLADTVAAAAPIDMRIALKSRINAHWAMFGEPPKVLFVNSPEYESLLRSTEPLVRYTDVSLATAGFENLMFKNIPVVYADQTLSIPNDVVVAR